MPRILESELAPRWQAEGQAFLPQTFTSNSAKLLKHPEKLARILRGETPSPITIHMALTNVCDLTCTFCCYANRKFSARLSLAQAFACLDAYAELGTTSVEFTGGGEPTLHPQINAIIEHAHALGYAIGICTNGKHLRRVQHWEYFDWVRLGLYAFNGDGQTYAYDLERLRRANIPDIGGTYIWDLGYADSLNPNIQGGHLESGRKRTPVAERPQEAGFLRMLEWVERERLPTRITVNAIQDSAIILRTFEHIRGVLAQLKPRYAFLSDFNYNPVRPNNHCYMAMVKPFIFPIGSGQGMVYDCPCTVLSPENGFVPQKQFEVCTIDDILPYYRQGAQRRTHDCSFCKFQEQNNVIDAMLLPTRHNAFA